jgi:TrmH family RNA methyltransferase
VLEGPRVVESALQRGVALDAVYFGLHAEQSFAALRAELDAAGVPWSVLKEGVLERVGSTVTPQPVLALARKRPDDPGVVTRDGLVVVAVGLADPGNAGTLLRSAEAAGAAGIVLCAGSVDAYNPKVVRASAGAIFGIPLVEGWSAVEALDALGEVGRSRLGAIAGAATPYDAVDLTVPSAVVLGNEAHGLGTEVSTRIDEWITVPMAAPVDSLNVAVAGSVVCFEAARQRAEAARR